MLLANALWVSSILIGDVFLLDFAEVWLESPPIYSCIVDLPIHVLQFVSAWIPDGELGVPKTCSYCLWFVLLAMPRFFLLK